jgi:hypothetical protein
MTLAAEWGLASTTVAIIHDHTTHLVAGKWVLVGEK